MLVVLGCVAVETTSLFAHRDDEEYTERDERSNRSAGKGFLIGGASGAAVGGLAGGPVGAGVGFAAGGLTGGLVGHDKDKQRQRRARAARNDQDEVSRLREENAALRARSGK